MWESLGRARLELGESAGALAALERALGLGSPNTGRVGFLTVRLLTEAGELDRAFERLESIERWLRFFADDLRTDPAFEPLRADPRLEGLLAGAASPPPE